MKSLLVEILMKISAVDFDESVAPEVGGRTIRAIGRAELLANERAAGRRDIDDARQLVAHQK